MKRKTGFEEYEWFLIINMEKLLMCAHVMTLAKTWFAIKKNTYLTNQFMSLKIIFFLVLRVLRLNKNMYKHECITSSSQAKEALPRDIWRNITDT